MYEPTYYGLYKWSHKLVEKFAWVMIYGDENDKSNYERSIRKLNKKLIQVHSEYSQKDILHDIEVLISTVKSLYGLIKTCSSSTSLPSSSDRLIPYKMGILNEQSSSSTSSY